MEPETILGALLRLLPALVVAVLAFVAAADAKTREQWTNLLYQAGALRPEQRSDARVQRGVRLPFFLVAAALLIWPIQYLRWATTTIPVQSAAFSTTRPGATSSAFSGQGANAANAAMSNSATGNTASNAANTASPGQSVANQTANQAGQTPRVDMFGRPAAPPR